MNEIDKVWRLPERDEVPSPGDWRVMDTDVSPPRVVYLRPVPPEYFERDEPAPCGQLAAVGALIVLAGWSVAAGVAVVRYAIGRALR